MNKQHAWAVLAFVLGASSGAALKPAFDGTPVDPIFVLTSIAIFPAEPDQGIEVCGALYMQVDSPTPLTQGCWSGVAEPEPDGGPIKRLSNRGRQILRDSRDGGVAHVPNRVRVFICDSCGENDGGWGIEAADDLGSASGELVDGMPGGVPGLARELWKRRIPTPDAGM